MDTIIEIAFVAVVLGELIASAIQLVAILSAAAVLEAVTS